VVLQYPGWQRSSYAPTPRRFNPPHHRHHALLKGVIPTPDRAPLSAPYPRHTRVGNTTRAHRGGRRSQPGDHRTRPVARGRLPLSYRQNLPGRPSGHGSRYETGPHSNIPGGSVPPAGSSVTAPSVACFRRRDQVALPLPPGPVAPAIPDRQASPNGPAAIAVAETSSRRHAVGGVKRC